MAPTIDIPNSDICSSSAGPITIDTIEISPVSIPSVTLKDFSGTFTYGSATAKNVEIEMTINLSSTFSGEVITPDWLPNVNVSGGINFDPFVQSNSLGDIDMDGGSFTMEADAMSFWAFLDEARSHRERDQDDRGRDEREGHPDAPDDRSPSRTLWG